MDVLWFIPTHGDGRYLGTKISSRATTLPYLGQIARAVDELGYVDSFCGRNVVCVKIRGRSNVDYAKTRAPILDPLRELHRRHMILFLLDGPRERSHVDSGVRVEIGCSHKCREYCESKRRDSKRADGFPGEQTVAHRFQMLERFELRRLSWNACLRTVPQFATSARCLSPGSSLNITRPVFEPAALAFSRSCST